MKKAFIVIVLAVSIVGSIRTIINETSADSSDSSQSTSVAPVHADLVGVWEADVLTFQASTMEDMDEAQLEQFFEVVRAGALGLTFNVDGTYSLSERSAASGDERVETGEWGVVDSNGAVHTVFLTPVTSSLGQDFVEPPGDIVVEVLDRDTMQLSGAESDETYQVNLIRQ